MKFNKIMKINAVDLALQFLTKSILRPIVFIETSRQRGSSEI